MDSQNTYNEKYWNEFSKSYDKVASCLSVFSLNLWNMLKVQDANSIIDCGCGPGHLLPYLITQKKPNCVVLACDLSDQQVKIAASRLQAFQQSFGHSEHQPQVKPGSQEYQFPLYNVTIAKANSEDLSFIENETFEIYSASLVLNLTENPEKMLLEAHRILKPKGRIGCSVWGERNATTVMTIFPKILEENNIQVQTIGKSNFHLNDRKALIKMFEDNGFEKIICWNSKVPFPIFDEEDLDFFYNNPRYIDLFKSLEPQVIVKLKEQIRNELTRYLQVDNEPLCLDGLFIIAEKK